MKKLLFALLLSLLMVSICSAEQMNIGVYSDGAWYFDMIGNGIWDGSVDKTIPNFGKGLLNAQPFIFPAPTPDSGLAGNNPSRYCEAGSNQVKTPIPVIIDDFKATFTNITIYTEDGKGCFRFCNGTEYHRTCCPVIQN
jgi:hypothetical protein